MLNEAREVVELHMQIMLEQRGSSSERRSEHDLEMKLRQEWATELSEICQGLAVARLIFNTDRSEDSEIAMLLKEALELRELIESTDKMAETLNSLGMLKQKQKVSELAQSREES